MIPPSAASCSRIRSSAPRGGPRTPKSSLRHAPRLEAVPSPHVKVKNGNRGNGVKHALYIAGKGPYGRDDVVMVEDGNLPDFAPNAERFFGLADRFERDDYVQRRKTPGGVVKLREVKGRVYKEVEAAIPRECKDPVEWARNYTRDLIGDKHPYRLAVHDKRAADGGRNTHLHLMFSTRELDGIRRESKQFFSRAKTGSYRHRVTKELIAHDPEKGGAQKSKFWNSRQAVDFSRNMFERHVSREVPGFKLQRSDAPEPKIGPKSPAARNGKQRSQTEYDKRREERAATVSELRDLKREMREVAGEITKESFEERKRGWRESLGGKQDMKIAATEAKPPKDWSHLKRLAGAEANIPKAPVGPQNEPKTKSLDRPQGEANRAQESKNRLQKRLDEQQRERYIGMLKEALGVDPEKKAKQARAISRVERESVPEDRSFNDQGRRGPDVDRLREKLARQQQERTVETPEIASPSKNALKERLERQQANRGHSSPGPERGGDDGPDIS